MRSRIAPLTSSLLVAAQRIAVQLRPPRVALSIKPAAAGGATARSNQSGAAVSCNRLLAGDLAARTLALKLIEKFLSFLIALG